MEEAQVATARAVLHALADLAPSTEQRTPSLAIPTEWFRWLPFEALGLILPPLGEEASHPWSASIDRDFGERLAAVDQIRVEQRALRVGWLFVAGRTKTEEGRSRRVFHPLLTVPVRIRRAGPSGRHLIPAGDAEVTELVTDQGRRLSLEDRIEIGGGALAGATVEAPPAILARLGRLHRYARSVALAAGFEATKLVPATDGPDGFMRNEGLVIVAGVAVYAIRQAGESSRASSLRSWSETGMQVWTAFHSLYLDPPQDAEPVDADEHLDSPYLLTPVQRDAVTSSRHRPVTLISGAPGTGKSHTIAAIACDALAQGERVLVAAKTDATVDALLDLLERGPGPDPVVFGSNERRDALAARLSAGQLRPTDDDAIVAAVRKARATAARRDELWQELATVLTAEQLLSEADTGAPEAARAAAPGLFTPGTDLAAAGVLVTRATSPARGWLARWGRRRARKQLVALAHAAPDADPTELGAALDLARAARMAGDLRAQGGIDVSALWPRLRAAEDEARHALGQWLARDSRSSERLNWSTLGAVAALATALRSGRAARREQLRRLDDDRLTRALPLWLGTLADADDLLPPIPALFDLVILDEASSVDQPLAAATLLRGRRAVIAGDPRQLRQVSFVSDAQLSAVMASHRLDTAPVLAARLDVRRNSMFDLATGACSVLVLDEHFRSDPHLVDFVARCLYDGQVKVATRSPRTHSIDCVQVVRTDGERDKEGVVAGEVARAVVEVRALLRARARGVGVVTPFRAQADALETAMLEAFRADDLEALDLRVGTVHAFQGNERDVIIASFGLGSAEGSGSWRFVEDPHLFAVFMTRARRRLIMLLSADPPEDGLVAAYLTQADAPRGPPRPAAPLGKWAGMIAADLATAGVPLLTAYPTGRHVVDLCLAVDHRSLGIECSVHPDGPDAHIERHLALSRAGWELVDAYRSRWEHRRGELAVDLVRAMDLEASAG